MPLDFIPDWVETHKRKEALYVYDVSGLTRPDDQGIRDILEPQGIQSIYTLPLFKKNDLIGFIGFDSVREKHRYAEKEKSPFWPYLAKCTSILVRESKSQKNSK